MCLPGKEQRAIATHRPPEHSNAGRAQSQSCEHRYELCPEHAQRVVAICPRMPVTVATVDGRECERHTAGLCVGGEESVQAELLEAGRVVAAAACSTRTTGRSPRSFGLEVRRATNRRRDGGPRT